jgi:hypothetical protein
LFLIDCALASMGAPSAKRRALREEGEMAAAGASSGCPHQRQVERSGRL